MTTTTYTEQQIIDLGGKLWTKADKRRVYLDEGVWTALAGLSIARYRSGNVCAASLDGQDISNGRGARLAGCVDKAYLDLDGGQSTGRLRIWTRGEDGQEMADRIRAGVTAALTPSAVPVTTAHAAAQLVVSVRTVRRRAAAGQLAAVKDGRGRWQITL